MDVSFLMSAFRAEQFPAPDRPEIAFVGRSNVGKSSLINTLVNRRALAQISSKPGKTRSINFYSIGKDVYFADLPGYGYASVPLEMKSKWKSLIENYLKNRSSLKAVVVILDVRRGLQEKDIDLIMWLKAVQIKIIIVITKIDKLSKSETARRLSLISNSLARKNINQFITFSSKTGQGKEHLWSIIYEILHGEKNKVENKGNIDK
jgi:GTP-binding protein